MPHHLKRARAQVIELLTSALGIFPVGVFSAAHSQEQGSPVDAILDDRAAINQDSQTSQQLVDELGVVL